MRLPCIPAQAGINLPHHIAQTKRQAGFFAALPKIDIQFFRTRGGAHKCRQISIFRWGEQFHLRGL